VLLILNVIPRFKESNSLFISYSALKLKKYIKTAKWKWENRRSVRGNRRPVRKSKRGGRRVRRMLEQGQEIETWVHHPYRREHLSLIKEGYRSVHNFDGTGKRPWYWWI
jgi:hypothetical protein